MTAAKDYRVQGILRRLQKTCYFTPLSDATHDALRHFWDELCAEEAAKPGPRELITKVRRGGRVGDYIRGCAQWTVGCLMTVSDTILWARAAPRRHPPFLLFN